MSYNRRHRLRGFTLLEVMLVLGILVVLAAFVIPQMSGAGTQAKIDAAKAMVGPSGTISQRIEEYFLRIGTYPEQLMDLVERPDDMDEDDDRWYQFVSDTANFLDPWQNELVYRFPGDVREETYDLLSKGPDGEEDTEDDLGNFRKED
jgi:general secretion pathway protein G